MASHISSIFQWLAPSLTKHFHQLEEEALNSLEEIRLRLNRPVELVSGGNRSFLVNPTTQKPVNLTEYDLEHTLNMITGSSIYALEEELKRGYITLPGGHRVGLCGKVLLSAGEIKTQKQIASLNFRIAREFPGVAKGLLPYLTEHRQPLSTVIVSPPCCGKTTLLRDLVRSFSDGTDWSEPKTVGLVDERSEVAAVFRGTPQLDVGSRTDVLDGCPKAAGMMMLVRSMAPQVIATDEIGALEDVRALEDSLNMGVTLLCTAHGHNLRDLQLRPAFRQIISNKLFKRIVILSRTRGIGTVEKILDGYSLQEIKPRREGLVC